MGMRSISKRIAWLSLLLTLWSAFAFAAHRHSNQDESATCKVCIAAHSASPAHASPSPKPIFRHVETLNSQPTGAKHRLIDYRLYVRPPPSV